MRTIELIKILSQLAKEHHKKVVTLKELSIFTNQTASAIAMALLRLKKQGCVERIGLLWINMMDRPTLEEIALAFPFPSYISFESALFRKNLLSQSPRGSLLVATTARPRHVTTPLGNIEFIHLNPKLFFGFDKNRVAHPEKALLDMVYVRKKWGLEGLPRVTFYWEELQKSRLKRFAKQFPNYIWKAIRMTYNP